MHTPPKQKLKKSKEFDWSSWNPFQRMPEETARRYMRKRRVKPEPLPLEQAPF